MPTADQFLAAAWQTAPRFGLAPESVRLLSHSENVVFEVALADRRLVMRLHRPGYNSLDELRSEVRWVQALGAAGLPVPAAVPASDGDYYVEVSIADEVRFVGVVEWVDGSPVGGPIEGNGDWVVDHYRSIGSLAARIRAHHATWTPPPGFVRRAWDAAGLVGESPLWGRFWEVEALDTRRRALFTECRDRLLDELTALPTGADHYGLIHADLHLGNLMADGEHLTVIDFDDAGHGWFAHELAVALHPVLEEPWEHEARASLVDGYCDIHPLSDHEEALIDTFLTMRSMMIIGWLDARRELPAYEHFPDLAEQAERAALRYLG